MSIKFKSSVIFSLLVFLILVANNTIQYFHSKDEMIKSNNREIALITKEIEFQVKQAREGSLFVEDLLGRELRTASIAIQRSLPADYKDVTNEQLVKLSKELMISHITLFGKTKDDVVGVKSSDPQEINLSTKEWGYWFTAFNQLFRQENITVQKGLILPNYWAGPIEVASSNTEYKDKWGYYYDGTTNYIIDPYFRGKELYGYEEKFGPGKIMQKFSEELNGVLELTVFNPNTFGKRDKTVIVNGNSFVRLSEQPIWYGTYKYENTQIDKNYIEMATKTEKTFRYIDTMNGKKIQKTFIPGKINSDESYVLGLVYDYSIVEEQLKEDLMKHISLSLMFMIITLITSVIFSNTLTKPLHNIVMQVNEIAKGNFGQTITVKSKDELGILAENVNQLSTKLKMYVDDLEESRKLIEYQALHDPLTSLANRRYLNEKLEEILLNAKVNNEKIAICFIDIDRFKNINDTLGHNIGDQLIKKIATRIKESETIRQTSSIISRQGGDEFIIIIQQAEKENILPRIEALIAEIRKPYLLENHEIFVGASCGVSVYPTHSSEIENLIMYADMAMYEAKSKGGNQAVFYDAKISEVKNENLKIENRLRKAIKDNKIEVFYQPKINAEFGKITGAEALVRWTDEELGFVSPAVFIPIAESTGLIQPIWEQVLTTACKQTKIWNEMRGEPLSISVNFSAEQFQDTGLMLQKIKLILAESALAPENLEVEITESILLYNTTSTIAALQDLQNLGIRIAVDDFGTGYSSLSYLRNLPIDILKIDQSFINDIDENHINTQIVEAIINLSKSLQLEIIAEGVEEKHQMHYLRNNGCYKMQGYLFSKPINSTEFEQFLKNETKIAGIIN